MRIGGWIILGLSLGLGGWGCTPMTWYRQGAYPGDMERDLAWARAEAEAFETGHDAVHGDPRFGGGLGGDPAEDFDKSKMIENLMRSRGWQRISVVEANRLEGVDRALETPADDE